MPPLTCTRCPFFGRWCRRYVAHFTAVGAAFETTARVHAARFSIVGEDIMLPFLLLVPAFTLRIGKMLPVFLAVGVGITLPIFSALWRGCERLCS